MKCDLCGESLVELPEEDIYSCQECGREICCFCISTDFLTCSECFEERA